MLCIASTKTIFVAAINWPLLVWASVSITISSPLEPRCKGTHANGAILVNQWSALAQHQSMTRVRNANQQPGNICWNHFDLPPVNRIMKTTQSDKWHAHLWCVVDLDHGWWWTTRWTWGELQGENEWINPNRLVFWITWGRHCSQLPPLLGWWQCVIIRFNVGIFIGLVGVLLGWLEENNNVCVNELGENGAHTTSNRTHRSCTTRAPA